MGRPAPIRITRRSGAGRADWTAMGAAVTVLVTEAEHVGAAALAVRAELDQMDAACGPGRLDSELQEANRAAGHQVAVGPVLAEAIEVALRAGRLTGGDLDPTTGAPGLDPGWETVRFNQRWGTLHMPAGVRLRLGATVRALAADRAAARAARATGAGVLVAVGADIAAAGPAPGGGWAVQVAGPGDTVRIWSGGLATCTSADRSPEAWRTVSVAAARCVDARIAASTSVLRGEEAPSWLRTLPLAARLVGPDGAVTMIGGWPAEARAA